MIDDERDRPVQRLWLYLTVQEVEDLLAALQNDDIGDDPGWHAHIDGRHDPGISLNVAVYDPDNLPDDPKIAEFFSSGTWNSR